MSNNIEDPPNTVHHQQQLVSHMMTPGVVQIPGDVSVTEAASLLERERMPCLLVKDTESCFGLMTPTDIVKKVVAQGLEPDDIEVRTIMTRPVQFIEYDRLVDEASALMLANGTPILIVTKQDQPVGVLTARDLILSPKRCLANIPAGISVLDQGRPTTEYRGTILQLSHVGALMEAPILLLSDTAVLLTFVLPDIENPLTVGGKILSNCHRDDSADHPSRAALTTIDVQFINLSAADQSRIKKWAAQQGSSSAKPS